MPGDVHGSGPTFLPIAEPDEWDLDVRLGELGTLLGGCRCGALDLADFVPTAGGGTCNTQNDTCPATCKATCAGTCPATCKATCAATCKATCANTCRPTCRATCDCGPTSAQTCNNTHCFTCRSGCQQP